MAWKDIFPGREEMRSNIIEVKDLGDSRKWYKASKKWLVASFLLTIALIVIGFIEAAFNQTCFSFIGIALFSPIIPGMIFLATSEQMKNIPARIELYADRLRFVYIRGSKSNIVDIPWGEIIDIVPYEKLKTIRNQEVRLNYLDKAGMDIILFYIESPEKLDISDVVSLMNLDHASRGIHVEPFQYIKLKGRNGNLLFGGEELVFEVDNRGVRLHGERGLLWANDWKDIIKISTGRGSSTRWIDLLTRSGKGQTISSVQFGYDDLRNAFLLMLKYCTYHRIPVVNMLGW